MTAVSVFYLDIHWLLYFPHLNEIHIDEIKAVLQFNIEVFLFLMSTI